MVPPNLTNWRKSSRSNATQACVAIAHGGTVVGIRDTKNAAGPVLVLGAQGWDAFRSNLAR